MKIEAKFYFVKKKKRLIVAKNWIFLKQIKVLQRGELKIVSAWIIIAQIHFEWWNLRKKLRIVWSKKNFIIFCAVRTSIIF